VKAIQFRRSVWLLVGGMACLVSCTGLLVTRSNAVAAEPPAAEKKESVLDSSADPLLAAYRAKIDAVLKTLPTTASPVDKIKALQPLFDQEGLWFLSHDALLTSQLLYDEAMTKDIWGEVRGTTEYAVTFKVLETTEFAFVNEKPEWINQASLDRVLTQLPRLHALGRFVARDTLERGFKTAMKPEKLDLIYPGMFPAVNPPANPSAK
jgi:hypothetical protein